MTSGFHSQAEAVAGLAAADRRRSCDGPAPRPRIFAGMPAPRSAECRPVAAHALPLHFPSISSCGVWVSSSRHISGHSPHTVLSLRSKRSYVGQDIPPKPPHTSGSRHPSSAWRGPAEPGSHASTISRASMVWSISRSCRICTGNGKRMKACSRRSGLPMVCSRGGGGPSAVGPQGRTQHQVRNAALSGVFVSYGHIAADFLLPVIKRSIWSSISLSSASLSISSPVPNRRAAGRLPS